MNRLPLLACLTLSVLLISCSGAPSSSSFIQESSKESNSVTFEINISHWRAARSDGGFEARYLMHDAFFPSFLEDEIDLSRAIAGDALTLTFVGDWRVMETYPGMFVIDEGAFIRAEVAKAEIIEVTIIDGAIIAPDSISLGQMDLDEAVAKDGELLPLGSLTKGYLSVSSIDKSEGRAIYAFDPRNGDFASVCGYDLGMGNYNNDWCK